MTIDKKAAELLLKFWIKPDINKVGAYMNKDLAKQCAVKCVEEIQSALEGHDDTANDGYGYWEQVKEAINLL